MDDADKHQKFIAQTEDYWKNRGKDIDIKNIHFKLSAAGCIYADTIIQSQKYIDRYKALQNEGKSDLEIADVLNSEIGSQR